MKRAPAVEAVAWVRGTDPLEVHFSLLNPPGAEAPATVPRVLLPAAVFVLAEVGDGAGATLWRSERAKPGGLKLDPASPESYVELQPGYQWGALLVFGGARLEPGEYRLRLAYTSAPYDGVGGGLPLRLEVSVPFTAGRAGGGP